MNYRLFGKSGLRVSEMCLGTMTFGKEWGYGSDYEESKAIFNAFIGAGGNFIDTANRYTEGTSERWLGDFIADMRESIVLATKYSLFTRPNSHINDGGNSRKNMVQSVEGSLRRLKTEYIDVLYVHVWDGTTPEAEVLRALQDLVQAGKVLYIAISDTPAWVISRMNTIAELRDWNPFIGLQVEYSLIQRTPERDLLPMAKHLGLSVTAWGALAGGALTGKYLQNAENEAKRLKPESARLNERNTIIAKTVVEIAKEIGCSPSHVALNWVRKQNGGIIPLIGARTLAQLNDNLGCLEWGLMPEQMHLLNEVSRIELGFPHDFLQQENVKNLLYNGKQSQLIV